MNQNTLTATHEAVDEVTYLQVPDGRIAYEVTGQGPLIMLSHGIGDVRQSYRFLAPLLVKAGYRVANADLRGHGDSSAGFESISLSDVAGDLLALIRRLGGPAVIVGQSLSGGAATIAAAQAPELVAAIVEINPFTRVPKTDLIALLRVRRYRRGGLLFAGAAAFHSLRLWLRYLDVAYSTKPVDWTDVQTRSASSRRARRHDHLVDLATASGAGEVPSIPPSTRRRQSAAR